MRWQKRARVAVAIFGIAVAVVVFFAIRERERPVAAAVPVRLDPAAIAETSGSVLQRLVGMRKDFSVACERSLYYENQDVKCLGARIDVKARHGRDFVITAAEARANEKAESITLSRTVRLLASDGFDVSTESATREHAGIVRTPAAVTFSKGNALSGRGVGMTYDENADVLSILQEAQVRVLEKDGSTAGEFSATTATFARQQNYLALEGAVHAVRGTQTIDADRVVAHLTENDEAITALELRGNARVSGGSSGFDAMSARDIDIHYGSDGETIERLILTGQGAITLTGRDGQAGRGIRGESLTIALAPDGSVTSAIGRDGAQLDLPGGADAPARHVSARNLDVAGEPGRGMTSAQFRDDVRYEEQAGAQAAARSAKSRTLHVGLDGGAITSAVFAGQVHFEEKGLSANGAEARYDPRAGSLDLKGGPDGGGPRVSDERISIEADAIGITLEGRRMVAEGSVKTLLHGGEQTPGLLSAEQPTNISAAGLRYAGNVGHATYTGAAQLWQGQTAIRGDQITIDQQKRNLSALGSARATFALGAAPSVGRADAIVYDNALRQIALVGTPIGSMPADPTPKPPKAAATPARPAQAQMTGPEGDLTADRITISLEDQENRLDQLDAHGAITLRLDTRVVTGARMTYYRSGRYDMFGSLTQPVRIVESCRETTGRALTFFKSADNIIIDGNEEIRTRTTSSGPCPQPPP